MSDVSRETMERLQRFVRTLEKWNPRINLVSKSSLADLWPRHVADSLQVYDLAPKGGSWVDLGSGGGFPGLICAIRDAEEGAFDQFTLVESDKRKSAFLREAAREVGVSVDVSAERIEAIEPQAAKVLTARALADLTQLLGFAERHLAKDGVALFLKGATWKKELATAQREWNFDVEAIKSKTQADSVVLRIQGVSRG